MLCHYWFNSFSPLHCNRKRNWHTGISFTKVRYESKYIFICSQPLSCTFLTCLNKTIIEKHKTFTMMTNIKDRKIIGFRCCLSDNKSVLFPKLKTKLTLICYLIFYLEAMITTLLYKLPYSNCDFSKICDVSSMFSDAGTQHKPRRDFRNSCRQSIWDPRNQHFGFSFLIFSLSILLSTP